MEVKEEEGQGGKEGGKEGGIVGTGVLQVPRCASIT